MSKCEARGCSLISLRINKGKKKQNKEKTAFLTDLRCVSSFRQIRFTVYSLHTEQSATRIKKVRGKDWTNAPWTAWCEGVKRGLQEKEQSRIKSRGRNKPKKWHDMNNNRVKKKKKKKLLLCWSCQVLFQSVSSRPFNCTEEPDVVSAHEPLDRSEGADDG